MRAVSFVEHLEFEFKGNIAKDAITLGDVDNDDNIELVVGNLQGDLAIFRGNQPYAWAEQHDLGMLCSIVVGNVLNEGLNSLVTISGEGWCYIFDVKRGNQEEDGGRIQTFHIQRLPANTKVALLADVDGDGAVELVLGLTDRVVRTYRWVNISQNPGEVKGKLVGLHKWEFANQVGSVSLNPISGSIPNILVAQPGGTYIKLECSLITDVDEDGDANYSSILSKLTPELHNLASSRMRNPNISSEIVGGICGVRNGSSTSSLIAIATLDGTLMLVDGDDILWSLQVDHQLFSLTKLDLTGDGKDEVVACAWDGQTYIVNQDRLSVRFQFEESACAFTAGHYGLSNGQTVPVLVYATFSDRVYIYYNVQLPAIRIKSLSDTMAKHPETSELLKDLPVDPNNSQEMRDLYAWCLYGSPSEMIKSQTTPKEN